MKLFDGLMTAVKGIGKVKRSIDALEHSDKNLNGHPDAQDLKVVVKRLEEVTVPAFLNAAKAIVVDVKEAGLLVTTLIEAAKEA